MARRKTGRPAGRPQGAADAGGADIVRLGKLHRRQVQLLRLQQDSLIARVEQGIERDPTFVMDEGMRAEAAEITAYLSKASSGMLALSEAKKKERESVPTDLLEAQFREELVRAAELFSEEQWAQLDEVRARLAREEAQREMAAARAAEETR